MPPPSPLTRHLMRLGYGTRRTVEQLFADRRVTSATGVSLQPTSTWTHDEVRVDGDPLDPPPDAVVLLHKPVGYVTSSRDVPPVVYELLPRRFLARTPVMAPVGRLDRDTSGLLLFTDDGALNHRLTSPRSHVPKTYEVELAEPLRGDEARLFASGTLQLESETTPLLPAELERVGEREARITLHEGRYHQVRRMFAATGNHVRRLQRVAMGPLRLGDLPAGGWRVLTSDERDALATAARRGAP